MPIYIVIFKKIENTRVHIENIYFMSEKETTTFNVQLMT